MSGPRHLHGPAARIVVPSLCVAAAVLVGSGVAHAVEVTSAEDDGDGTLRAAIDVVNTTSDDTITFALPAGSETIVLESDLPDLVGPVILDATGTPGLTIDGDGGILILRTDADTEVIDLATDEGVIEIGEEDTLTFTANSDFEVGSDIDDVAGVVTPGSLVKQGEATLTLTGTNTFSGGITIEEGTLVGDVDSLPGDIVNDGALVFDQAGAENYFGVISGSGSLEKTGGGALALIEPQTYGGGTLVSEGVLLGNTSSIQGDVEVAADADLVLAQTFPGEFADDLSGEGALTVLAPGTVITLSGDNTYTGGTIVEEGTLSGDVDAIQGDVELLNVDSHLVFVQPGDGGHAGNITGAGTLTKQGAGNLTLTGSNDYSGGTAVDAGTLTGDADAIQGDVALAGGTTLVFQQGSAGTFDGAISGDGDVEKQGAGTLTIATAQTYTGSTLVAGGTLELTGSLMGSGATVENGATLTGNGSIMAPVVNRGTLSPGGSALESFSIGGDTAFEAGSSFVVDVGPGDTGDTLSVTGNVDVLPTASIDVRPTAGDYSGAGTTVVVLDATGTLTGTFVEGEPFAFLDRTITYPGGNSVQVTLVEDLTNVANAGSTPNQRAVSGALAMLAGSPDPDIEELFDNLITITESQVDPALDSLSGESLSAMTTARVALGERMQRTIHRRMRSLIFAREGAWPAPVRSSRGSTTRTPLSSSASSDVAAPPRLGERGIGGWLDGYGVLGELDGDGNSADVDYGLFGTTVGGDYRLGDHVLLGAAAGYAYTDVQVDDRNADGDAHTAQGALYAGFANPLVFAGASGRYAWSRNDHSRDIEAGMLRRKARADFDGHDYGLRGELALRVLETGPVAFEPLAGFEWNHLTRESFTERGAGNLGLDVDDETIDTSLLQVGARLHGLFDMEEESVLAPELRGYWLHEFGDTDRLVEASLAGAPLVVTGAEAPRDSVLVGAGWAMTLGWNVRATADYDLRIDSDRMEHLASISVRGRF